MPLPWKKAKVSRISRIVADLQPPKPNSMVVQTGFPTSLVDLFVKNRDRLKTPIKKKKKQHQHNQPREVEEFVVSDTTSLANAIEWPVEPVNVDKKCESPEKLEVKVKNVDRCEVLGGEYRNLDCNQGIKECGVVDYGNLESNRKEKRLLCSILKMFVVVVLALSTTRLAVGITMSASLLIFLEYEGRRLLCLLKTCMLALLSVFPRVVSLFRFKKDLWVSEKGTINVGEDDYASDSCDSTGSLESNIPLKDIQPMEPRIDMVGRVETNERVEYQTTNDLLYYDKRWDRVDGAAKAENDEGGQMICGKEHSQSCKLRRKFIKKLVPKKLRSVKRERKGNEREAEFRMRSDMSSCCWVEDKLWRSANTKEQSMLHQQNSGCKGKQTLMELLEEEKEEEQERFGTGRIEQFERRRSIPTQALQTKTEMIAVQERVDIVRGGNSGYLILFLVVLAGLIGGRMLALVATVASCSMLKLLGRRSRCEK